MEISNDRAWWGVRIYFNTPDEQPPEWHLDSLVAHRVVLPLLREHEVELNLWRFHRRAAPDENGHRFAFLFYSSLESRNKIYKSISQSPLLKEMETSSLVKRVDYEKEQDNLKSNIGDTSDATWPPELKASWPYFIMGASQLWIGLIDSKVQELASEDDKNSLVDISNLYQEVEDAIGSLWHHSGHHALLHHLNAIFGYVPVQYKRGIALAF